MQAEDRAPEPRSFQSGAWRARLARHVSEPGRHLTRPHLLLTHDFPPMGGGIARWMAELARAYPPDGMVISTGAWPGGADSDRTIPQRVDRLRVNTNRLRTLPGLVRWSQRAAELSRSTGVEFVWCSNFKPAGYPALWVHRRQRIPYGIIFYGSDLLKLQHRIRESSVKRRTAAMLLGPARVLVAISRWSAEQCRIVLGHTGLGSASHRIRIVSPGTDPGRFRPGLETETVRSRYQLERGRWLLTVCRLVEHKSVDTAIRAFAALSNEFPDLRYAVAGVGETRPSLEALARFLGVGDRVRFLGLVGDAELPHLFNLADVYVGVSRQMHDKVEGFGLSLVEASASGVAVVGGTAGGIPDAVRDGETGLLANGEDPQAVAAAVKRLLDDDALRARLASGGRKAVETFYNWDRVTRDLRSIAEEILMEAVPAGERLHPS